MNISCIYLSSIIFITSSNTIIGIMITGTISDNSKRGCSRALTGFLWADIECTFIASNSKGPRSSCSHLPLLQQSICKTVCPTFSSTVLCSKIMISL